MEWHEAFNGAKRSTSLEASNFTGSMTSPSLVFCQALGGGTEAIYIYIYIYRTLAWNQAIDLVGWNAYMVWVIFLAIYPSGYIPFQPAHPL